MRLLLASSLLVLTVLHCSEGLPLTAEFPRIFLRLLQIFRQNANNSSDLNERLETLLREGNQQPAAAVKADILEILEDALEDIGKKLKKAESDEVLKEDSHIARKMELLIQNVIGTIEEASEEEVKQKLNVFRLIILTFLREPKESSEEGGSDEEMTTRGLMNKENEALLTLDPVEEREENRENETLDEASKKGQKDETNGNCSGKETDDQDTNNRCKGKKKQENAKENSEMGQEKASRMKERNKAKREDRKNQTGKKNILVNNPDDVKETDENESEGKVEDVILADTENKNKQEDKLLNKQKNNQVNEQVNIQQNKQVNKQVNKQIGNQKNKQEKQKNKPTIKGENKPDSNLKKGPAGKEEDKSPKKSENKRADNTTGKHENQQVDEEAEAETEMPKVEII